MSWPLPRTRSWPRSRHISTQPVGCRSTPCAPNAATCAISLGSPGGVAPPGRRSTWACCARGSPRWSAPAWPGPRSPDAVRPFAASTPGPPSRGSSPTTQRCAWSPPSPARSCRPRWGSGPPLTCSRWRGRRRPAENRSPCVTGLCSSCSTRPVCGSVSSWAPTSTMWTGRYACYGSSARAPRNVWCRSESRPREPGDDPAVHPRDAGAVAAVLPASAPESLGGGMAAQASVPRSDSATVRPPVTVVPRPYTEGASEDALTLVSLWAVFKESADRPARERLILHYAPLVTMVAGRVGAGLPSTVEKADLVSYGMFGLIDAIEKYETDRAVKFETYASARIRGAIIDELRAIDWIPRSVRTKARAVDRAYADLEGELRRPS